MSVNFEHFLYGGDYNPDQWLEYPDILKEDIRLMKQAHINTVSLPMNIWESAIARCANRPFGIG